jgi:hypothetical protein
MTIAQRLTRDATMSCPECVAPTPPLSGSSMILAWYLCSVCGHFWLARLRDGRPVVEIPIQTSGLSPQ